MQYKCDVCNDTGSRDKSGDYLDCVHCDAAMQRKALNDWLASQYKQGAIAKVDNMDAWMIYKQALAMAPKQEADHINDVVKMVAPAAANGAEDIKDMAQARRVITQLRAAAGPDAALIKALEMAVQQNEGDMLMTGEECRQCRAALSGAKGN